MPRSPLPSILLQSTILNAISNILAQVIDQYQKDVRRLFYLFSLFSILSFLSAHCCPVKCRSWTIPSYFMSNHPLTPSHLYSPTIELY